MDWKTLITAIQGAGMSQAEIGVEIGKSQAWVSAVANGAFADLKWSDGQALLTLHSEKVGPVGAAKEA